MKNIITIILCLVCTSTTYAQFNTGQLVVLVNTSVEQLETAQKQLTFLEKAQKRVTQVNNIIRTVNDINSLIYSMKNAVRSITRLSNTVTSNRNLFDVDYYSHILNEISYLSSSLERSATDAVNLFSDNTLNLSDSERLNELRESTRTLQQLTNSIKHLVTATSNVVVTSNLNKIFL